MNAPSRGERASDDESVCRLLLCAHAAQADLDHVLSVYLSNVEVPAFEPAPLPAPELFHHLREASNCFTKRFTSATCVPLPARCACGASR
jgi:hypothetical protein